METVNLNVGEMLLLIRESQRRGIMQGAFLTAGVFVFGTLMKNRIITVQVRKPINPNP